MEEGWFCKAQISTYSVLYKEYVSFIDHVFASFTKKADLRKTIVFFFQKESFTGCMKGVIHSPKMAEGFGIDASS